MKKAEEKLIQMSFWLFEDDKVALAKSAKLLRLSMSEIIRRLIREVQGNEDKINKRVL